MKKAMGVLGGTFDPVHNGHIHLALECYRAAELSEVRLIPLNIPAHRVSPDANSEQRLAMLRLASNDHKELVVDDQELRRNEISYTINTLRNLRKELGEQSVCLIVGMDAFQAFNTWHEWRLILDFAHIIVADRPGNKTELKEKDIAELFNTHSSPDISTLHENRAGSILKIDLPMLDISATQIRDLIASGKKVTDLLPEQVYDYIQKNKLYRIENG